MASAASSIDSPRYPPNGQWSQPVRSDSSASFVKSLGFWVTKLPNPVSQIVADYAIPRITRFGAEEWRKFFGVEVDQELELSEQFYQWWIKEDAINPSRRNYETHLPPVLRPKYIKKAGLKIPVTLHTMEYLAKNPKEGHRSQYFRKVDRNDYAALQQNGNKKFRRVVGLSCEKGCSEELKILSGRSNIWNKT